MDRAAMTTNAWSRYSQALYPRHCYDYTNFLATNVHHQYHHHSHRHQMAVPSVFNKSSQPYRDIGGYMPQPLSVAADSGAWKTVVGGGTTVGDRPWPVAPAAITGHYVTDDVIGQATDSAQASAPSAAPLQHWHAPAPYPTAIGAYSHKQWRRGKGGAEKGNILLTLNFWLSENCPKIYFLSENVLPKLQI